MAAAVEELIPFEAAVRHDGRVDVLVDGAGVTGGSGLSTVQVLDLLTRYAAVHGPVLMTTTHPSGRVVRDLISPDGRIAPFYPEEHQGPEGGAASMPPASSDQLLMALHGRARKVRVADLPAPAPAAPATTRVRLGSESIPQYNVEADVQKTIAARSPRISPAQRLILALTLTVAALVGVAAGGWAIISSMAGGS